MRILSPRYGGALRSTVAAIVWSTFFLHPLHKNPFLFHPPLSESLSMPNSLSFRSGQVILQKCRVETDTVIEPGDMIFLDETVIRPANDFFWNTDLATTRQEFASMFLGIAHEASADGEVSPVSVDVSATSVYEFDVASSTYDNGNTLGPDEGSSDLLSQQLEYVASSAHAVARAAEYADSATTRLRVTFASAYTTSSSNSNAAVG